MSSNVKNFCCAANQGAGISSIKWFHNDRESPRPQALRRAGCWYILQNFLPPSQMLLLARRCVNLACFVPGSSQPTRQTS